MQIAFEQLTLTVIVFDPLRPLTNLSWYQKKCDGLYANHRRRSLTSCSIFDGLNQIHRH